jgi:hypothetical protein
MKIEVNGHEVELHKHGTIKTKLDLSQKVSEKSYGRLNKLVEEFFPLCGNRVVTQFDCIKVQPHTYTRRVTNCKDKEYLEREIGRKNRSFYSVADNWGLGESTIRSYASKYGVKRPLNDTRKLEELWEEHDSVWDLARAINEDFHKVKIELERQGVRESPIDTPEPNP